MSVRQPVKRYPQLRYLFAALVLFGAIESALAQNLENGRRLSERWCSECHAIDSTPGKSGKASSFASIAARETVTADMIATFLRLPHATMPNLPLSRKDAEDLAAFVLAAKK